MKTGGILLATVAVLSCTACLGGGGKLEVRSVSGGLKAGNEPVPYRIAEARGQLAIGNVALALEGFRKAAREDPGSVDAQAGIAHCYDQMGRFDLSRRHYEQALALAPTDTTLLGRFAGSLDRQGLAADAASVRREMAAMAAVVPPPAVEQASAVQPVPSAPDVAAPVGQSVTIALAPVREAEAPKAAPSAPPKAMPVAPVGRSVTIALPPIRPAPAATASAQPRLERVSLTEVALVTGSGPRWKRPAPAVALAARRPAPAQLAGLRVLNAARVEKLAARTRTFLGNFGWREIAIGDADAVRQRSLIVYPSHTRAAAARLSKRLGFAMAPRDDVRQLTILLGRDAAGHPALRPRG